MPRKTFRSNGKAKFVTKRHLTKVLNQTLETKYKNNSDISGTNTINFNGNFTQLSNPAQGTGDTSRIGDSITLKGLRIRGTLAMDPASTVNNVVRLMIVQYHPDNSAQAPQTSDLLQASGSAISVVSSFQHDESRKFRVLWNRTYALSLNEQSRYRYVDIRVPMKKIKKKIQYLAGSATSGFNQIYLFQISNVNSSMPVLDWYSNLRFTDS